jgi:hypothetical protein
MSESSPRLGLTPGAKTVPFAALAAALTTGR